MDRNCPSCGREFDATIGTCPHCGTKSPAWKHHEGQWWQRRGDRWWVRDNATGTWKPHGGAGGIEPETVDAWAMLTVLNQHTALLRRIAFWVTLFGALTLLGMILSLIFTFGVASDFGGF